MAETKNLCAQVPISLRTGQRGARASGPDHQRVHHPAYSGILQHDWESERRQRHDGENRTMAFQIPEELFQRIKRYLERESLRTGRKLTQRDFVLGLITQALDAADADGTDTEQDAPTEAPTGPCEEPSPEEAGTEPSEEDEAV